MWSVCVCVYVGVYTMEYYSTIKKNEIIPFVATWMDLEIITLSEVSQKEKDKYHTISFICRILKKETNELIYKTETDSQRMNLCGGKGIDWEFGTDKAYIATFKMDTIRN